MAELVQISKILRQTRAEKKYTLEQISQNTRISLIILRKIESCDFQSVSDVYLRAYLKQYAEYLELDDVLIMIDDVLPVKKAAVKKHDNHKINVFNKTNDLDSSPTIHISPSPDNSPRRPLVPVKTIFIIICIVLIPILFIRGCKNVSNIVKDNLAKRKQEKALAKEASSKDTVSSSPSIPAKRKDTGKEAVQAAVEQELNQSKPKKPTLRIMTKDNVFVRVKADGVLIFKSTVLKGSQETWYADDKLEVMISKPSSVMLEIFSKTIPTRNFKKPVTYTVTPKGFNTKK